jgi:hypothetical protein
LPGLADRPDRRSRELKRLCYSSRRTGMPDLADIVLRSLARRPSHAATVLSSVSAILRQLTPAARILSRSFSSSGLQGFGFIIDSPPSVDLACIKNNVSERTGRLSTEPPFYFERVRSGGLGAHRNQRPVRRCHGYADVEQRPATRHAFKCLQITFLHCLSPRPERSLSIISRPKPRRTYAPKPKTVSKLHALSLIVQEMA